MCGDPGRLLRRAPRVPRRPTPPRSHAGRPRPPPPARPALGSAPLSAPPLASTPRAAAPATRHRRSLPAPSPSSRAPAGGCRARGGGGGGRSDRGPLRAAAGTGKGESGGGSAFLCRRAFSGSRLGVFRRKSGRVNPAGWRLQGLFNPCGTFSGESLFSPENQRCVFSFACCFRVEK